MDFYRHKDVVYVAFENPAFWPLLSDVSDQKIKS